MTSGKHSNKLQNVGARNLYESNLSKLAGACIRKRKHNSLLEDTVLGGTLFPTNVMSTITEAVAKLENLSQDRANKVVSLIDDLAELEALETAADLKAARAALANPGECITVDEVERRLVSPFPSGRG